MSYWDANTICDVIFQSLYLLDLWSNPDDPRRKTISLLEEYFSVQILDEALQCVEELKDPALQPEVAKEAISLALEKSPPCVGPVIKLLEFLLSKKVLIATDIGTGCLL